MAGVGADKERAVMADLVLGILSIVVAAGMLSVIIEQLVNENVGENTGPR